MAACARQHDFDWLVVGSGFGGSVSAWRLTQKGYRVGVLESGKRFTDKDFPRSTWDIRRYFFAPRLGLRGIFRLSLFKDVTIVSGAGVGGGSLGYSPTRCTAPVRASIATRNGRTSMTGSARWQSTTTRPSGCSGSRS